MSSDHPFRLSLRQRLVALVVAAALVAVAAVIWATPEGQRVWRGPTATEVALRTEQARAADLSDQLEVMEAKLTAPRPPAVDTVATARAQDLKTQLEALQGELTATQEVLGRSQAEAAANLDAANVARGEVNAARERHEAAATVAAAQIADLRRQVEELTVKVQNPKGYTPPPVTASMTKEEIIASSKLFGLYTMQSPFDYGEFNAVQAAVERDADISGYFQSWETDFRPDAVEAAWSRGQIPLMTWESQAQVGVVSSEAAEYSLSTIIDGEHDDYLRRYAADIAAAGLPLIIRFNHEMNGTWYPWSEVRGWDGSSVNGNAEGEYVTMWRHVHDIFEAEGANDLVVWLWAPNRVNKIPSQPHPEQFYPGDEYVDWVGLSGYYRPGDPEPTFDDTYGQTLPLLREAAPDKPIFLAEIGATEDGGNKGTWITDLFQALERPGNADIIGLAWFSLTVTADGESGRQTNDWRLNSSGVAVRAAAAGLTASGLGDPRE